MPELVKLEFKQMPKMRVVGKAIYPKMDMKENPIPAFWSACFNDGSFKTLEDELSAYALDSSYVGFMCEWTGEKEVFTYICGLLMEAGCPVPEGFLYKDVPASTAAVGWIQGPEKEIYKSAHEFTQNAMEKQGFRFDEAAEWCMELYNCPRFTTPLQNGDVILDYYIPCVRAEEL